MSPGPVRAARGVTGQREVGKARSCKLVAPRGSERDCGVVVAEGYVVVG
jgi:hypothetical protein